MAELLYAIGITIAFSCLSENLAVLFKQRDFPVVIRLF